MVMRSASHVNILRQDQFAQIIVDDAFRDAVLVAYLDGGHTEFDVTVTTVSNLILTSTFTAVPLVQLTNQDWVKSIAPRNVARMR